MHPKSKEELDNLGRLHQMKINTRLVALESAHKLLNLTSYEGKRDHVTLIAIAGDVEKYILGELEEEAKAAMEQAQARVNVRPIMRP